jgi:nitronate monooxygenase
MAGMCPPERAAAISRAGSMGAFGALLSQPDEIASWVRRFRALGGSSLQINLWLPDPPPARDREAEASVARFLEQWGPPVPAETGDARPPDFAAQCDAVLAVSPTVVSSIMGVFPAPFVDQLKARGIAWFATATTAAEARAAEAAGADAIVAQGMEAGGHRGAFDARDAERALVGLFALVPRIADCVRIPIVAAGGIGDGRTAAAAFTLGASAVTIGTALLRCPETELPDAWHRARAGPYPQRTMPTRASSGRPGRAVATHYVRAAAAPDAPAPAPYPVQRALTAGMRADAVRRGDVNGMQVWTGQGAALARAEPAADVVQRIWGEASELMVLGRVEE